MLTDVIVVNWNAGIQLHECVESVLRYDRHLIKQIVVVDNGSTDDSERAVETRPDVTLIRTGVNLGFGKACNQAAKHTNGQFLLFLNPDAQLFPGSLANAIEFMQRPENSKVGICGIQLVDENGNIAHSCARFPTASGFVAHATGLDRVVPTLGHFMSEWDHASTRPVDHVIGAFFLVRRHVFEALHGFDETFFLYLEDLDFSYRANQLGWSSVYLVDAQAFHAGGGTSRQVKAKRLFYSLRSRILYAFKHFNPLAATITLLVTLLVEPVSRSALALARGSWASMEETMSAYRMLYRWLPEWVFQGATR